MKCNCSSPSVARATRRAATLFGVAIAASTLPVKAEQFVLLDATYTATADNTQTSQYTLEPESDIPADFRTPIDFANGSVHVELRVLEKPSSQNTLYNICFENSTDYACLPYIMYTETGTYKADPKFSGFWQYDKVDWSKGVDKVLLIVKDDSEQKAQGDSDYYPYKAHVTLTVVSPGSTFDPKQTGNSGAANGGSGANTGGAGGAGGAGGKGGMGGAGGKAGAASPAAGGAGGGKSTASAGPGTAATTSAMTGTSAAGTPAKATAMPASTAGKGGAGAKPSTVISANSIPGASSSDAGAPSNVSAQLEDTSGCSVAQGAGAGRTPGAGLWSLLALAGAYLAMRRRRA